MCTDTEGLIKIYMSFLSTFTNYSRWQNGHINRIYCAKDPQGHIITTIMDTNYLRYGGKKKTEENRRKMRDFVVFHTLPNVERQLKSSLSSDINLETDSNLGHKLSAIRVRCVSFTCMSVHSAAARWVINFFVLSRVTVQRRQDPARQLFTDAFRQSWPWTNRRGEYKTVPTAVRLRCDARKRSRTKRLSDIFLLLIWISYPGESGTLWLRYIDKVRQRHCFIGCNGLLAFCQHSLSSRWSSSNRENCARRLIFTVEKRVGRL